MGFVVSRWSSSNTPLLLCFATAAPDAPALAAGKERPPLRAGYLGHLTLVANRMIGAAGRRRTVKRFLDDSSAWAAFVDGALKVDSGDSTPCVTNALTPYAHERQCSQPLHAGPCKRV